MEGLAGEVFCDGFYVGVDDGLFAGSALEVLEVLWIIHKEVLCEDCGAKVVAEDVEVFFPVGVVVGVVCSDASVWEVLFCSFVEAFGKFVGRCLPFAGCLWRLPKVTPKIDASSEPLLKNRLKRI